MAEGRWAGASVRLRTTAVAVLVVGLVLALAGFTLVSLVRTSLRDGLETSAEQRARALAEQIRSTGLPEASPVDPDGPDDLDDSGDLFWQVVDEDGVVLSSSHPGGVRLPTDEDQVRLPDTDSAHLLVTEDTSAGGRDYEVVVAVSLEDVEESVDALVVPLLVGLPLVLVLMGGTTWAVAARALGPVERIRREVEQITGTRLDRRVPEPPSRDEIHRLARTMNQMLGRLEDSHERQQRFVADASHELRSPLASIRQAAEVSRAHPGALGEGELADAVLEESVRMQRLVEQMLLLTQADEGAGVRPHHDVDVDDLALAVTRRIRDRGLTVDTSAITPGRVRGDRAALTQVVRNLVDNAARHARTTVAVGVREDGDAVEMLVQDDGSGIPEDQRHRVFDRFVRLDEARARDDGGSGLGLAIVREIVSRHGGTVAVESSPMGGASFVVRLPAPVAGDGGGSSA